MEKSELLEDILEDVEDIQYRVDMVKMALEDILNMDSDDDDEGNRLIASMELLGDSSLSTLNFKPGKVVVLKPNTTINIGKGKIVTKTHDDTLEAIISNLADIDKDTVLDINDLAKKLADIAIDDDTLDQLLDQELAHRTGLVVRPQSLLSRLAWNRC